MSLFAIHEVKSFQLIRHIVHYYRKMHMMDHNKCLVISISPIWQFLYWYVYNLFLVNQCAIFVQSFNQNMGLLWINGHYEGYILFWLSHSICYLMFEIKLSSWRTINWVPVDRSPRQKWIKTLQMVFFSVLICLHNM